MIILKHQIVALTAGCVLAAASPSASMAETFEIDQIMDMTALVPHDLYRFEPNYYWVKSGDTIRFRNSTGNHTVKSVKGIWPEGVKTVDIAQEETYDIKLTKPGVYGFRCKVHARHGMFALVIVDTPEPNLETAKTARMGDWSRQVFDKLLKKMADDRKARGK